MKKDSYEEEKNACTMKKMTGITPTLQMIACLVRDDINSLRNGKFQRWFN